MKRMQELEDRFFCDLKKYNKTNFRTLLRTDLEHPQNVSVVHKAFSSVVTRYFIFSEMHEGELTDPELRQLYFALNIDLISQYFANYPDSGISTLKAFQDKLLSYDKRSKQNRNKKKDPEAA